MLPTPSTSHVNYDQIYEPAEDSFLFLDTLSGATEQAYLRSRFPANTSVPLIVEVGTGSGVVLGFVTAHAEAILGRSDLLSLGVDINRYACVAASETIRGAVREARGNGNPSAFFAGCLLGDLTASLKRGSLDVVIFNPPYVPSETVPCDPEASDANAALGAFERDSHLLSLTTDGGADGMEVTNRLLEQLPDVLSPRGLAYILLCAQNKPDEVLSRIRAWKDGEWVAEKVGSSGNKAGWERLCIVRISRATA